MTGLRHAMMSLLCGILRLDNVDETKKMRFCMCKVIGLTIKELCWWVDWIHCTRSLTIPWGGGGVQITWRWNNEVWDKMTHHESLQDSWVDEWRHFVKGCSWTKPREGCQLHGKGAYHEPLHDPWCTPWGVKGLMKYKEAKLNSLKHSTLRHLTRVVVHSTTHEGGHPREAIHAQGKAPQAPPRAMVNTTGRGGAIWPNLSCFPNSFRTWCNGSFMYFRNFSVSLSFYMVTLDLLWFIGTVRLVVCVFGGELCEFAKAKAAKMRFLIKL